MPELPPDQCEAGIWQVKLHCWTQPPAERVTAQLAPVTTAVFPVRSAPLSACIAVVRDPSTGAMKSFLFPLHPFVEQCAPSFRSGIPYRGRL